MNIKIREFQKEDIPYKVKWINDKENNQFLHYDLPLKESKTLLWFESIQNRKNRKDYTITVNNIPVGIIGLPDIDKKNKKAEYYITLGEKSYKGKGVATAASDLLFRESRKLYDLNKIYPFTEISNIPAQKLFEKLGFSKEGLLKQDLIQDGKRIDRYVYGLLLEEYFDEVD